MERDRGREKQKIKRRQRRRRDWERVWWKTKKEGNTACSGERRRIGEKKKERDVRKEERE